jgi:hypothetical protein
MSRNEWYEWQRSVIRGEEYKDIKPFRDSAQKQVDKTMKDSLLKVKRND